MKRTKRQKIEAQAKRVNSQISYNFNKTYNQNSKNKKANSTDIFDHLASTKKDLYKSLMVAILILLSLMVIYWVQK